jgi:hypothetical protein
MMQVLVRRDPLDVLRERVWIARSCEAMGRIGELAILNGMVAMLLELGLIDRSKESGLMRLLGELVR